MDWLHRGLLLALAGSVVWAAKIDTNLDSALLDALYRGDSKAAIPVMEYGANPNARSAEGIPALTIAVLHADRTTVNKLIERGADLNARSGLGRTALTAAASVPGGSEIVRILLSSGADPNLPATTEPGPAPIVAGGGETALIEAVKDLTARSARLLLEARADPNAQDKMGNSALHLAAIYGNTQAVRMLLARHAGVNVANKMGSTPLINAAIRNDGGIIRMLLDAGAEVKAADGTGSTALMWASYSEKAVRPWSTCGCGPARTRKQRISFSTAKPP